MAKIPSWMKLEKCQVINGCLVQEIKIKKNIAYYFWIVTNILMMMRKPRRIK